METISVLLLFIHSIKKSKYKPIYSLFLFNKILND